MSLQSLLTHSFERHSKKAAIWCDGSSITYEELNTRAVSLASYIAQSTPPNGKIGIASQKDIPSIVAVIATVMSGRAFVPLNPSHPEARLGAIIEASALDLILATAETIGKVERVSEGVRLVTAEKASWLESSGAVAEAGMTELGTSAKEDPVYYMFTSGTTGTPKGVRVNVGNLEAYLGNIQRVAKINKDDRCTHFFDLSFDLSVHDIFVTLTSGAELVILPENSRLNVIDFVNERDISCWFSVPTLGAFCDRMGALQEGALPKLRLALFCGEALPIQLAEKFANASPNAELYNLYGPTEATIAFTSFRYDTSMDFGGLNIVPIGQPLGDLEIDLVEQESGMELVLGGSQITPGYINNPKQQEKKFFTEGGLNWYRSGDAVAFDGEYSLHFLGRIDDQVKINGFRVELAEIDACLRSAAHTPEAASLVWQGTNNDGPTEVIGFVAGTDMTSVEIRRKCRLTLPSYMVPRKIIALDKMPTNASGKIDRQALKQIFDNGRT